MRLSKQTGWEHHAYTDGDGRRPTTVVLVDFCWRFIPPVSSCDRGWSHGSGSSVTHKSCALEPLPTAQHKAVVDIIAPFLTELFNRSLASGFVPEVFKVAYCISRRSWRRPTWIRQMSDLSVVSKLLESLVARQLLDYLSKTGLLQCFRGFSLHTASAIRQRPPCWRSCRDILLAGDLSALVLLDLSAAFESVDHDILIRRLKMSYGRSVRNGAAVVPDVPGRLVPVRPNRSLTILF